MQTSSKRSGQPQSRPRKSSAKKKIYAISIIGAGRMGTALGLALKAAGFQIQIVVAKRPARARRAARTIGGGALGLSADQLSQLSSTQINRLRDSTLILIATPDDAIAAVARQLAAIFKSDGLKRPSLAARVALHTSGALSADVLKPLRRAGFAIGSMHPLISVSESRAGAGALAQAFFSVEGDPAAVLAARSVVRHLGAQSFVIESRYKSLYHGAAVMSSPHVVALFDMAREMLGRCGVSSGRARQVLLPLMRSTIENLSKQKPEVALTGTFKRGDAATARKHIEAITAANLPDILGTYLLLGERSIELAQRAAPDSPQFLEIARLVRRKRKSR